MPGKKRSGNNHYDVAFLGDSLATLLAATILVKKGCKALIIHNDRELPVSWLTSSLILERILDLLDGRSCCTTPFPFQIITKNQRVDFNGKNSLADELRRELPSEHKEVATFLDDMLALGEQLEELLWEHQGLPINSLGNKLRFKKKCFRADIPGRVFRQTLRERLTAFKEPAARKFLTSLFCGYSFAPSNKLTLAECALIWSGLGRQSGIIKSGLSELLWHRYKQFHGDEDKLHRLARIRTDKAGAAKFLFEDDKVASADHIVFADRETIPLCEGLTPPPTGRVTRSHLSGDIKNRISPLLAKNVIIDGNPPLRLNFEESDMAIRCHIENAMLSDQGLVSPDQIEKRVSRILPFTNLALTPKSTYAETDVTIRSNDRSALMSAFEKISFDHGRKYLYCGNAVIPELGTVGEVLVALTVANKLLQETGNPPL